MTKHKDKKPKFKAPKYGESPSIFMNIPMKFDNGCYMTGNQFARFLDELVLDVLFRKIDNIKAKRAVRFAGLNGHITRWL